MQFGLLRGILSTLVALGFIATIFLPSIAFYITKATDEHVGWIQYLITRILLISISAYQYKQVKSQFVNSPIKCFEHTLFLVFDLISLVLSLFVILSVYKAKSIKFYIDNVESVNRKYFSFIASTCLDILIDVFTAWSIVVIYLLMTRLQEYRNEMVLNKEHPLKRAAICYSLAFKSIVDWIYFITVIVLWSPWFLLLSSKASKEAMTVMRITNKRMIFLGNILSINFSFI